MKILEEERKGDNIYERKVYLGVCVTTLSTPKKSKTYNQTFRTEKGKKKNCNKI
jgi:hypothetical protein